MTKKLIALALACMMALSLVACGNGNEPAGSGGAASGSNGGGEVTGLTGAIAEQPALLTSGGQSADYQMIATVMGNLGLDYTSNNLAKSDDLAGYETLVVAVGGSSKGLGAAGIDADGELARLTELLDAAQAEGLTIIVLHTGGAARRGDLSDKFIEPIFIYADYAIVVESGDTDGLMAGICANNNIPMDSVAGIGDVPDVLGAAFK